MKVSVSFSKTRDAMVPRFDDIKAVLVCLERRKDFSMKLEIREKFRAILILVSPLFENFCDHSSF